MRSPAPNPAKVLYPLFAATFGGGLYLFFKGFRVYWQFRVLRNTPLTAIRGLAMGLVRVYGRATGDEYLTSPLTRQPCYLYKLKIEKWEVAGKREYWAPWRRDSDSVQFYLEDETGKVLVYPRGAELDLGQTAGTVIDGELPETLLSGSQRLTSTADVPAVEEDPELGVIRSMAMIGSKRDAGRYRVTEYCILPQVGYAVTGSCVQNPLAKEEGDRNLIKKGTKDPTFTVSDKGPRQVEMFLDLRALAYIFGGALLTVVSASVLLLLTWPI